MEEGLLEMKLQLPAWTGNSPEVVQFDSGCWIVMKQARQLQKNPRIAPPTLQKQQYHHLLPKKMGIKDSVFNKTFFFSKKGQQIETIMLFSNNS